MLRSGSCIMVTDQPGALASATRPLQVTGRGALRLTRGEDGPLGPGLSSLAEHMRIAGLAYDPVSCQVTLPQPTTPDQAQLAQMYQALIREPFGRLQLSSGAAMPVSAALLVFLSMLQSSGVELELAKDVPDVLALRYPGPGGTPWVLARHISHVDRVASALRWRTITFPEAADRWPCLVAAVLGPQPSSPDDDVRITHLYCHTCAHTLPYLQQDPEGICGVPVGTVWSDDL